MIAPGEGSATLEGLDRGALDLGERHALREAADRLGQRVPADEPYRLGELAILWQGVPPDEAGAWIMVCRLRPPHDPKYEIYRALLPTFLADAPTFERMLTEENRRRAWAGQPTIPPFEGIREVPPAK